MEETKAVVEKMKESDLLFFGLGLPKEEFVKNFPENLDDVLIKKREKQMHFLHNYMNSAGQVHKSAESAGVSPPTVLYWRKTDPIFKEAYDRAKEEVITVVEDEIIERAIHGTDKKIFFQGQYVDTVKQKSDLLIIFLAKKLNPEYRDNNQTNIGIMGSDIKISFTDPKPEKAIEEE